MRPHSQAGDLQEEQSFLGELCGGALGSGEVVGWRVAKDTLRLCCSLHSWGGGRGGWGFILESEA